MSVFRLIGVMFFDSEHDPEEIYNAMQTINYGLAEAGTKGFDKCVVWKQDENGNTLEWKPDVH